MAGVSWCAAHAVNTEVEQTVKQSTSNCSSHRHTEALCSGRKLRFVNRISDNLSERIKSQMKMHIVGTEANELFLTKA